MEKHLAVPQEYDEAINETIAHFAAMNQPRYKGYLKLMVRPAGANRVISQETYCMDKDDSSHQKLFDIFCGLLKKASEIFGKRDFLLEISNQRNDVVFHLRVNVSRKAMAVVTPTVRQKVQPPQPAIQPPPVEPVPPPSVQNGIRPRASKKRKPETGRPRVITVAAVVETPVTSFPTPPVPSMPAHVPAPAVPESQPDVPAPEPARDVPTFVAPQPESNGSAAVDAPWEMKTCQNPQEGIDYKSMKFFPTEATPGNIRKVFDACGIRTNGDILARLGTLEPTRTDWEIFIRSLRHKASLAGAKLWPSSDGTLYWWLSKKMRWIRPFPKQG